MRTLYNTYHHVEVNMKIQKSNNKLFFATYNHQLVVAGGRIVTRTLIVLKSGGIPMMFTTYDRFVGKSGNALMSLESNNAQSVTFVCRFLNFCFFEDYHIKKLTDINSNMIITFLQKYGACTLNGDENVKGRSKNTVGRCVNIVIDFIRKIEDEGYKTKVDWHKIYQTTRRANARTRKVEKVERLAFEIRCKEYLNPIFRDITEDAFQIIMSVVLDRHQNIMMLVALGAFAGLRPSEACNVRREEYGGIKFEWEGTKIRNITIDISTELNLRSDGVPVGGIKKHREQKVYPNFINVFSEIYNEYMDFIEGRKYETDYGPLTTNNNGMAITYNAYLYEFKKVVEEARKLMLLSNNPRTQSYGQMLFTHSLSPHIFRHFFTMKLVQYGETVPTIMFYRGDKNPNSATTYIQNKSELIKQLNDVEDEVLDYSMWRAERIYGQSE